LQFFPIQKPLKLVQLGTSPPYFIGHFCAKCNNHVIDHCPTYMSHQTLG
jgi:hypothetical protein